MKKRILSLLFCIVLLCAALSVTAFAADEDYAFDDLTGALTVNTADGVTKWKTDGIDPTAVKSVTFASAVTSVTGNTYYNLANLESMTFEGDVTVGGSNFNSCPSLKKVIFNGESTVNDSAFASCGALETVKFGKKTSIGASAFDVSSIGGNSTLKELVFPAGSTMATNSFFKDYTALESVTFEGNIEIGGLCFQNCSALKTVVFKGTSTLRGSSFVNCPNIETLTFGGKTEIIEGALSSTAGCAVKKLVFPAGSTMLPYSFFKNWTALESVTFEGDIELGGSNFSGCTALKSVIFKGKSTLDSGAFGSCPAIETLTFGKATSWNSGGVFSGSAKAVKKLVFPAGSVLNSASSFFSGSTALESVIFEGDIELGGSDFASCTALKEVVFNGTATLTGSPFINCTALKTVIFKKTSSLTSGAFFNCPAIETLIFGGATSINSSGNFGVNSGNNVLKTLVFPAGSTFPPISFFKDYTALESVAFEGDITLGGSDFLNCTSLKSVVFEGNATISDLAFKNCPALTSVVFKKDAVLSKNTFGSYDPSTGDLSSADNVMTIRFESQTVPTFAGETFGLLKPENVTIYVPCISVDDYKSELGKDTGEDPNVTYNSEFVDKVACFHSFTAKASKQKASDATCTEPAYYYVQCDRCDEVDTTKTVAVGNPLGHDWGAWESIGSSKHQRICKNDPAHIETAGHQFVGNTCVDCGYTKSSGGGDVTYYTLTFNTNGGSVISSVSGTYGKGIDLDKYVPSKDGFDFGGWYSDSALTTPVDEIKLTGNKTVYAKWTAKNPNTGAELPFTDVKETDWSYEDIAYVYEKVLMQGTSETTFAPQLSTSRAMIVTILWRLEGEPVVNYAMSFTDVAADAWYTEAIRWAQANGIVNGYSAEKFGTNDPITREQMAAILYRYAQTKGEGFTGSWMFLLDFEDRADVSGWADEAMHWCVMKNIISGVGNNLLNPQGKATREQVAAILHRFCENIVK